MDRMSLHRIQPYTFWTLDKGLFANKHPVDIPPQGASAVKNVLFNDGFLRARHGFLEAFATGSTDPAYHVSQYTPLVGVPEVMRLTKSGGGGVDVLRYDGSWTNLGTIAGGNTSDVAADSVNFKGEWFVVPGDANLHVYDGSTLVDVDSRQSEASLRPPAKPRLIAANDARVFVANVEDPVVGRVPYRIAWSDTLNANIWQGGFGAGTSAVIDLAGESDPITALYATSDIVVVFKPRTIYIGTFVGPPQFYAFRRLVRGPGCISNSTLKEYRDGLLVWLGDDNVYLGLPGQRPQPIANAIEDRIRDVVKLSDISKARAVIDRDNHLYTLFLPDLTGSVYKIFTCSLSNLSWWEGEIANSEIEVLDGFTYRSGPWTEDILVGTSSGKLFRQSLNTDTDDGVSFDTSYTTGVLSFERMTQGKSQQANVQLIRIHARRPIEGVGSSDMTFTLSRGNSLDRFTDISFGTQTVDGVMSLYTEERSVSEHFKVKMESTGEDHPFIASLSVGIIPEGHTRRTR